MPLYEYQCDACGHRFEVIQKYSDAPIDICPTCGGAVHKLFSSPAIQFKGSGFYITDYARAGKSDGGSGGGGAKAESGGSSESKGDSKTDGKSDGKSDTTSESRGETKSESKGESKGESKSESKPAAPSTSS
jgi:putative FmdB family regulatory protein